MTSLFQWIIDLLRSFKVTVTVLPWEQCVRVRWGKYSTVLGPGVHWKFPWIDRVWPTNSRLRFAGLPAQTLMTRDEKTITIGGIVGFRIVDPLLAMQTMQQPEYSCAALAQAVISSYVPQYVYDELSKESVELAALEELQKTAPGFEFEYVTLTDWALVRAIRLLNESWRPETRHDKDPYDK